MNYNVGDIFTDDKFYTDRANFCNENGYFISEIEPLNGVRRFQICKPVEPEKTLEELKEKKLDELTAAGHQFDNQLVNEDMIINSALGFKANADLRSQNNINGLIAANKEPVAYVDSQNAVHTLSLAQLNTLLAECIENGQYLYQQKWAYRAQINACTTKEELEAITFDFKMKDFANE